MSIQIVDCSLRDGGYIGDKNFPKEFIDGVMNGLINAGIDLIETGFLQTNVTGDTLVYANSEESLRNIPIQRGSSEFVGFCDNSRYCIEKLDEFSGKAFTTMKISFAKHECKEAVEFCKGAMQKGYKVFVQPMDATGYTMKEREDLLLEINKFKPTAFAIVDTFGTMHLDDLNRVFKQINEILDKDIKIALHTHNNLGIANALVEQLITLCMEAKRNVVVDGSLLGMARGAGNSCTEEIAAYINSRFGERYNLLALIETIERYIMPIKEKEQWGYDVPMLICGIEGAHVDNVSFLKKNTDCDYKDMYTVIGRLKPSQRKRYGASYSKTDFSLLYKTYEQYKREEFL